MVSYYKSRTPAFCAAPSGPWKAEVERTFWPARAALRVGKWKLIRHEICVSYFNPMQQIVLPAGCDMSSCSMVGSSMARASGTR